MDDIGLSFATFRIHDPALGRWLQVDPLAEALYSHSPYNAMGNNPITNMDPDGDLPFLAAVAIGAGVSVGLNGIQNVLNDRNFLEGWQNAAITGAVGGALGYFGGGSLISEVLWGAAQGGITGAVSAGLNDGNVAQGFFTGALIGAGSAFLFNLPQAVRNYKDGFGFNTNIGVFQDLAKHAVVPTTGGGHRVDPVGAQEALNYWTSRFGGPNMNYLSTRNSAGKLQSSHVDPQTGRINISGVNFIQGAKHVTRTIVHESAHYYKTLNWSAGPGSTITPGLNIEGVAKMGGAAHGTIGYYDAIRQAGKYNMGYSAVAVASSNGFGSPLAPVAWNSFGITKWWHILPKRF